ncbi:MAG: ParB/RepB/Spo0J family partition protein [Lachnospiraceae bacterium]|nr:ParB/RepB/Spo0J family partition protein [Lachnospiraceae bacterium]
MAKKTGLGRGLDALIPESVEVGNKAERKTETDNKDAILWVKLTKLEPDPEQPRKDFGEDEINELADSIKTHGVFQPLIVQKKDRGYMIVAGERRWRAAKIAGLHEVPVIVKELTEQEKFEIQLLENLQRQKLNPIEEGQAYRRLISEYGLKQDELGERIGKNRVTITNAMRLLNLDNRVQQMVIEGKLTQGHARSLLGISDGDKQYEMACRIFDEKMTVREIEKMVRDFDKPQKPKGPKKNTEALDLILRKYEDEVRESLGAKVTIKAKDQKKGRIEIEYYSAEELEMLVKRLVKGKTE